MAANQQVTGLHVRVVPASLTYVTLCDKSLRQGFSIYNNSTGNMYIRFGDNPLTEWTTKVAPNHLYETMLPLWRGVISAKWDNTVGDAHITEFS